MHPSNCPIVLYEYGARHHQWSTELGKYRIGIGILTELNLIVDENKGQSIFPFLLYFYVTIFSVCKKSF